MGKILLYTILFFKGNGKMIQSKYQMGPKQRFLAAFVEKCLFF